MSVLKNVIYLKEYVNGIGLIDKIIGIKWESFNRHKKLINPFVDTIECHKKIDPIKIIKHFKPDFVC